MEESIQAAQERNNAEVSSKIRKSDIARNWMLGLLGIIISMTSVLSLTGSPVLTTADISNTSIWFAKSIASYPVVFLTLYGLLYFFVNVLNTI